MWMIVVGVSVMRVLDDVSMTRFSVITIIMVWVSLVTIFVVWVSVIRVFVVEV